MSHEKCFVRFRGSDRVELWIDLTQVIAFGSRGASLPGSWVMLRGSSSKIELECCTDTLQYELVGTKREVGNGER